MRPDEDASVPFPVMFTAPLIVLAPVMVKMPALIFRLLTVLLPLSVVVPVLALLLVKLLVPVIAPLKAVLPVPTIVRPVVPLLLMMLPPPAMVPIESLMLFMSSVAPEAIVTADPVLNPAELPPNLIVPTLMFVWPVFVQSLPIVIVLAPLLVTVPLPEMTPEYDVLVAPLIVRV